MRFKFTPDKLIATDDLGTYAGQLDYPLIKDHTKRVVLERVFVVPQFRESGLAQQLVQKFVGYAKKHKLTVKLMCPYAITQFKKHPEYQELLLSQDRFTS